MAGRDESAKLQGMLSEIAATVGEMGAGRNWGANAIRQIARPDNQAMFRGEEFNLDNSANLMKMAQWSERNGYDDKAKQYMALGYKEKEREALETKESRSRMGESANMHSRRRIADIASDSSLDAGTKKTMIQQEMAAQQDVALAYGISPTTWDSGTAALAAINKEQADSQYNTKVNNIQNVITEAERRADAAPESEKPAFEASLDKLYERLNNVSAENGERLGDSMRDARRARQREDAADLRSEESGDREQLRLDYTIAAARATEAETEAIRQAEAIATQFIGTGQYEVPEQFVKVFPPKTVIEANKLLEDQRKRDEAREEARANGTVQPATLDRARILAESDTSIATLLKNYETVKDQSVHGKASLGPATALTEAVIARDKATSEAGKDVQMSGAVGGQMQALLDQGSYSSWLDGFDDYAEVMKNDDQFIQMRNAVSTLAKQEGLKPEDIDPETLDRLMDTAAKGLSKEWRKAEQRRSRMRNNALTSWKRTLTSDGMAYRDRVVKEYKGKTQWDEPELDAFAEEHYETAVEFFNRLVGMNVDEQNIFLAREMGKNDPIFEPKEIGITGFKMPAILDKEEFDKLWEMVKNGQKISINTFIEG